jgi:KaiC/GvpD/RAD55 family RecA-like ATPase
MEGYTKNTSWKKPAEYGGRSTSRESVESILQLPFAKMPERGITEATCETFNVRMSVDTATGRPVSYYFPAYDKRGKLTGWKRRDLTKTKTEEGHFTAIGKVGVDCQLFGQKFCTDKTKRVFITEGEIDQLSVWQTMKNSVRGTQWEGMFPAVVSLTCGTASAVEAIQHNVDWLKGFEKIILGFDSDEATEKEKKKGIVKGKEATEDVAASLMADNVYVLQWKDGFKDPSDYLQAGEERLLAKIVQSGGQKYVGENITRASKYTLEELFKPKPLGVMVEAFPLLSAKLRGWRPREMHVVTALSGIGKSSVVTEIAYAMAKEGKQVGMIFLEEEDRETMQRLVARYLGINYNKFKFDPFKHATEERLAEAQAWVNDRFVFVDHFGSMRIDSILNKMKTLVFIEKVDFIILDHLSMVISGNASKDERKDIDMAMTELAAFTARTDVGTIIISHLNRDGADDLRGLKIKDEPIWIRVRKEDLRGSAAIEQLSWVVLGIEAEIMPDRTRGRVRLTILKNRPTGWMGECDTVKMDDNTGSFIDASDATLGQYN